MKRIITGIIAVLAIGTALTGCADMKGNGGINAVETDTDEKENVLTDDENARYIEKGAELNGFEKYEDIAEQFVKAVNERDTSQLKDAFYIRDEMQYLMPIDQGMFGLIYKQALALITEPGYEIDYQKEAGSYTADELQYADDMANMYYVYAAIEKDVAGGKEPDGEERAAVLEKIDAFDFDFKNTERPVKVTEGKYYEVGLKKGDDLITMLFSIYKVNGERWFIQSVECSRVSDNRG